jgi:hypothetical protein
VGDSLTGLAQALRSRGQRADAEAFYREALGVYREALPPGHPDTLRALSGLARASMDRNDWSAAEPLVREGLDLARRHPGRPDVAEAESIFGGCLAAAGRLTEAEPLLRRSHALLKKKRGEGSRAARETGQRLAEWEEARDRADAGRIRQGQGPG